jgi:glyoxylase-like metal-dependent hydrolase (beta-lactamase superfamily II)
MEAGCLPERTGMIDTLRDDIMGIRCPYSGKFVTNYLLLSADFNIFIDTGIASTAAEINDLLRKIEPPHNHGRFLVVNTHGHWDHIGLNSYLVSATNAIVAAHAHDTEWIENHMRQWENVFNRFSSVIPSDGMKKQFWDEIGRESRVNIQLIGGERFSFGSFELEIIHCPGHSPGSICVLDKNSGLLFSGDTIQKQGFFGNIPLYTDVDRYINTLSKLKKIDISFCHGAHDETIKRQEFPVSIEKTLESVNRIEGLFDEISKDEGRRRTFEQLVMDICRKLGVNYSIHAYWTVFAHVKRLSSTEEWACRLFEQFEKNQLR